MKVYKCDICGTLYEPHKDRECSVTDFIKKGTISVDTCKVGTVEKMDICPHCESEISKCIDQLSEKKRGEQE